MTNASPGRYARGVALRRAAFCCLFAASAEAQLIRRGSEFQVNQNTYVQLYPAVASLENGGFVVAWQNVQYIVVGDVLARRFDAIGEASGGELVVDTSGYGAFAFRGRPTIATRSDDGMVVVWQHAGPNRLSIQGRLIDSAGTFVGNSFEINTNTSLHQRGRPHVAAMTDGAFVVVWDTVSQDGSRHGSFVRRFDSAGVPRTGELQISHRTLGSQLDPVVAALPNGEFVVVWQDEIVNYPQSSQFFPILARRFDSLGVAQAAELQVNEQTAQAYRHPAIDSGADGSFVVVWSNVAPNEQRYRIVGRRFDSAGVAQSETFMVSSHTTRGNLRPAIAMDDSGDFLVVWQSHVVYGEPDAVLAQLFDAGGAPVGAEFQVSLLTGVHRYPAVATDDEGRFVVAWNRQTLESPAEYPVLAIVAQRLAMSPATLDIDGDGDVRALTDGLLLIRHRLGLADMALTSGAVATACTRCDGTAIDAYITSILADLDLDGDGTVGALTDGLVILRSAFGLRGPPAVTGAVGESCTRCDAESIAPRLVPLFA